MTYWTIEQNDIDRQMIRSIVDLASIFRAKVCAEGVETEGMREILRGFRVGSFQGYFYAKPLTPEQFAEWRKNG